VFTSSHTINSNFLVFVGVGVALGVVAIGGVTSALWVLRRKRHRKKSVMALQRTESVESMQMSTIPEDKNGA